MYMLKFVGVSVSAAYLAYQYFTENKDNHEPESFNRQPNGRGNHNRETVGRSPAPSYRQPDVEIRTGSRDQGKYEKPEQPVKRSSEEVCPPPSFSTIPPSSVKPTSSPASSRQPDAEIRTRSRDQGKYENLTPIKPEQEPQPVKRSSEKVFPPPSSVKPTLSPACSRQTDAEIRTGSRDQIKHENSTPSKPVRRPLEEAFPPPSSSRIPPPSSVKPTLSRASSDPTNPQAKTNYVLDQNNDIYVIPEGIKNLIEKGTVPGVLKMPLSPSTYKDYFAALLYAEDFYSEKWSNFQLENVTLELHQAAIYNKKSNKKKKLNECDEKDEKTFVVFELDNVPERRPFLLSRDFVFVRPCGRDLKPFQGY